MGMNDSLNFAHHCRDGIVTRLQHERVLWRICCVTARPVLSVDNKAARFAWVSAGGVQLSVTSEVGRLGTLQMAGRLLGI